MEQFWRKHQFFFRPLNFVSLEYPVYCTLTQAYQFNDFDEHPIIGRWCHQFEENWGQAEIIFGVLSGQLTNDVNGGRLYTYAKAIDNGLRSVTYL